MKKFLIIQLRPETEVANNELKAIMDKAGINRNEIDRIRGEVNGLPIIDLNKYSAIIVGGSPFDISTPHNEKTDIQKRVEEDFTKLFDKVVKEDFPFLGACSGSGLLGNYCGANISRKYGEPVGGVDMKLTEEGQKDDLLKGLPITFRVLVGHKEACDNTPDNAVLLGSSETCPVQMFRVGSNVYATQFHPEADPYVFELRINYYKNNGYFPADEANNLIKAVHKERITEPQKILKIFADKYRR